MKKWESVFFGIDQGESGTAVEEITKDEYSRRHTVMVMTKSLELRKQRGYPKGNVVERIMEQFIRDRIPVGSVEKIVASNKLFSYFAMQAGVEVSLDIKRDNDLGLKENLWIFDGIIPIEFTNDVDDYKIIMRQ